MLPTTIIKGDDVSFTIEATKYSDVSTRTVEVQIIKDGVAKATWQSSKKEGNVFAFEVPHTDTAKLETDVEYVLVARYTAPKRDSTFL